MYQTKLLSLLPIALKDKEIEDLKKVDIESKDKIKVLELELRDQKMFTEVNQELNVKYENLRYEQQKIGLNRKYPI